MSTDKAGVSRVPGLVKDLVNQFERPLDFYRELIQNAIDSGSNRVDVSLEYLPAGSKHPAVCGLPPPGEEGGWALICVEDDGEGMDERIIDDYLLILFRSTKEGDLTKIGKFGIGFVSIFAIHPQRVRLHTARGGESWRLDFPSYESYDKYRVKALREGTLVEVVKAMGRKEYDELVKDSRKAISSSCKHSEARIYFADRSANGGPALITEPFDLPGGSVLQYEEEGTEIVLAFSCEERPFCGFYNRGLTLKETQEALFPGVAFKAKSRYIEHTLTRDSIIEDDNYRKLMRTMKRLVERELPARLRTDLEGFSRRIAHSAAEGEAPEAVKAEREEWARRADYLRWLTLHAGYFSGWGQENWAIFPALDGRALSFFDASKAASRAGGGIFYDTGRNTLVEELERGGHTVLAAGEWIALLALWLRAWTAHVSQAYMLPKPLGDDALPPETREFLKTLRRLDSLSGAKYRSILAAELSYPGSCIQEELFVTQRKPGALSLACEPAPSSLLLRLLRPRRHCLINAAHPAALRLARLHRTRPRLAAFLGLKMLHLGDGSASAAKRGPASNLSEKTEAGLLEAASKL